MTSFLFAQEQLKQEAHVWLARPEDVLGRARTSAHALLDAGERARLRRFVFARDQHLYLVAHALLRTTLSRYAPIPPEDWRFVKGPHGRPELAPMPGLPPLRFNLSHTPGLCACVVTLERDVGVDVERVRGADAPWALAELALSERERSTFTGLPEAAWRDRFYTHWTLKEAYTKALGVGLLAPLDRIDFGFNPRGVPLLNVPVQGDLPRHWQFLHWRPLADTHLALALRRGPRPNLRVVSTWTVPGKNTLLAPAPLSMDGAASSPQLEAPLAAAHSNR